MERFGSNTVIAQQLLKSLETFPAIKGPKLGVQVRQLHDKCNILMLNIARCPEINILHFSHGLKIAKEKLPKFQQDKWRTTSQNYEDNNAGVHPPFSLFISFLNRSARELNNANYESVTLSDKKEIKTMDH